MSMQWENHINLGVVKDKGNAGAHRGLGIAAEHVLGVSNVQVPHEDGDFERSGVASVADGVPMAAISYKDTAFPGQAEWLHENLDINHDEGRNAKFLENALNSERDTAAQIVATAIREDLGT